MTDFLARLAERALGVAPVAHPLIPSLYAPDVNGLLPELPEREDDSTPATEDPSALDATGPSPPVIGPADAAGRHSADPFGRSTVADSIRHDAMPSKVASAPSSGRRPPSPGTTPARSPVDDGEHRGEARVPSTVPERPVALYAEPPVTPSVRRALHATSSLDGTRDGTRSWRPLGPRVVANETASLAVREPPSLEVPPAPTAVAPTIRVTIGRIEVRAAAPPTPPEPEPTHRPEPALSLDAYLKLRREAAR